MAHLEFIHLQPFQTYSNLLKRSTEQFNLFKQNVLNDVSKSTELSASQIIISIRPFLVLLLQQD